MYYFLIKNLTYLYYIFSVFFLEKFRLIFIWFPFQTGLWLSSGSFLIMLLACACGWLIFYENLNNLWCFFNKYFVASRRVGKKIWLLKTLEENVLKISWSYQYFFNWWGSWFWSTYYINWIQNFDRFRTQISLSLRTRLAWTKVMV